MKLFRKFGLVLFSIMLFCGMSGTAFAVCGVDTFAKLHAQNSPRIFVGMSCDDNKKHDLMCIVKCFDDRGNEIFVDKEKDTVSFQRGFDDCSYWSKAKVYFYKDNRYIGYKLLRRKCEIKTSAEIGKRRGRVTLFVDTKNAKEYNFEFKLRYYDYNDNEIYSENYVDRNGGFEGSFDDCENWDRVEIEFFANNELVSKETLTK